MGAGRLSTEGLSLAALCAGEAIVETRFVCSRVAKTSGDKMSLAMGEGAGKLECTPVWGVISIFQAVGVHEMSRQGQTTAVNANSR
jgi:hypothetical protein